MARFLSYAGLALLALGEVALIAFAADAEVSEPFRAFYIDRSSSCLPQPASGAFSFGRPIPAGRATLADFDAVTVCGTAYTGPDGTWVIGPEVRFRFSVPPGTDDLLFTLEGRPGTEPGRRMTVLANDTGIGTLQHADDAETSHAFTVPRRLLSENGRLDLTLVVEDPPLLRNTVSARQFTFFIRSVTLALKQVERGSVSSGTAL